MKTKGLRVTELQELFSQWPNSKVDWFMANRNGVIYASPDAERKMGIGLGQHVAEHPFVRKALVSGRSSVEQYQTWQDDQLVSTTLVAVPMDIDDVKNGSVLVYGVNDSPSVWKAEEINTLIQEINRQTSSVAALQTFVRGCITLFGCMMAAIWVKRTEKYYLLAKSTDNSQAERCLNEFRVSEVMSDSRENKQLWNVQSNTFLSKPDDRPIAVFDRPGFKHVLSFPLRHLGEELGILELFSNDALAFDGSTMLWLNQLGPLVASLVYGHEMRLVALEREQDLNLLLWGTEIFVQIQTEAELLEEAGEMAMVLNLEAGFFFMRQENNWHVQAPFGRLKQNNKGWEPWVFGQIELDRDKYIGHEQTKVFVLSPPRTGLEKDFPWRKLLIQPVETNSGIIGELWLLDFFDTKLESRKEVFAAFARSLGVALETIQQRQRLEKMATTDSLTGILNRQGFSQRLRVEMASTKRRSSTFLLLLLDLDGFKILNDTQGHPVGDRALCTISSNLQTFIRENDILARSGGDEISLVLADMRRGPEATSIINRLKERMGLEEFKLGVSIGVAEFPTEADNYERLYHLADERLYIGKHSGKNKVVFDS